MIHRQACRFIRLCKFPKRSTALSGLENLANTTLQGRIIPFWLQNLKRYVIVEANNAYGITMHKITRRELIQAQIALFVAILLQLVVSYTNHGIFFGSQTLIIGTEIGLALIIGFTANAQKMHAHGVHHNAALILLGLISAANMSSLLIVLHMLITGDTVLDGLELLSSALAIFLTNIIVYALWYWEIDSPGLTRQRWSKSDKDFQFMQQDRPEEFVNWKPEFVDYIYLSLTNAVNFAPADTRPVTHAAKLLMGSQAVISVLTLALVLARSVSILGS